MRRTVHPWSIGLTVVLMTLIVAVAQGQSASQTQKPAQPAEQTMSMGDMMKGCREHCQATTKSIDQVTKTIDDAKASNDPAKMRAALDEARTPLAEMKEHMGMCMNMMSMMEKMHGKGGMMNKQ